MIHGDLAWYLVQGTWYMVHGTLYMVHGTWYMVYGTWYLVFSIWYWVLGTNYPVSLRSCSRHRALLLSGLLRRGRCVLRWAGPVGGGKVVETGEEDALVGLTGKH